MNHSSDNPAAMQALPAAQLFGVAKLHSPRPRHETIAAGMRAVGVS